jgi:hypothetical protein
MTGQEQADFIRELCENIATECIVDLQRMPKEARENWDGHELRELIFLHARASASMSLVHDKGTARRRRFRNFILIYSKVSP